MNSTLNITDFDAEEDYLQHLEEGEEIAEWERADDESDDRNYLSTAWEVR